MAAVGVTISACAGTTTQTTVDESEVRIHEGVTTKADVSELLGTPQWITNNGKLFHYVGDTATATTSGIYPVPVPFPVPVLPGSTEKAVKLDWYLQVNFDENDRVTSVEGWEDYKARGALLNEAKQGDRDAAFQLLRQYNDPNPIRAWSDRGDYDARIALWDHGEGDLTDYELCASYNTSYYKWKRLREMERREIATETELVATSAQEVQTGMSECAMLARLGPVKSGETRCGRFETLAHSSGPVTRYIYRTCDGDAETVVEVKDRKVVAVSTNAEKP